MFISLTKKFPVLFTCVVIVILICPKNSIGYGYKKNEDPLITVFKSVIFNSKNGDWDRVKTTIDTISDRIDDVNNIFAVNLRPRLNDGLSQHDFQEVVKVMANLVFLALREKNYWNLTEGLRMFSRAKVRLRIVDEYYTLLLSGNVRKYDKLNGTQYHEEIFNKLAEARKTLGSIGFLGAGSISPRPEEYERITREIEQRLLIVFPYFESGEEITY